MEPIKNKILKIENITSWVGSTASLVVHTLVFVAIFLFGILGVAPWELLLLILTTVVSLEAIYLAIFIQITVNRNTASLKEVEEDIEEISEDVEEIQEDVEELGEDVEGIQEDIEEISEDVEEIQEDVEEMSEEDAVDETADKKQEDALALLTADVKKLLLDLEQLKEKR